MIEDNENRLAPTLTLLDRVRKVEASKSREASEAYEPFYLSLGVTHSAIITRSGDLFTGGSKLDGQLGIKFI